MVAVDGAGAVAGTFFLKPNSLALGAHMANASSRCKLPGGFPFRTLLRHYGLECEYRF